MFLKMNADNKGKKIQNVDIINSTEEAAQAEARAHAASREAQTTLKTKQTNQGFLMSLWA